MSALISRSSSAAVSYVQHRATLDFVYPPPARHQKRHLEGLHEPHAIGVAVEREVETPEPIRRERVRAALQHHRARAVRVHHLLHHGLENRTEPVVVHAVV
jgi:hypothetical protein